MRGFSLLGYLQVALFVFLSISSAFAGEPLPEIDHGNLQPGQRELVNRYLEAVAARDVEGLRSLYHPRAFSCITDANARFNDVEDRLEKHFTVDFGESASLRSVPYEAVTAAAEQALEGSDRFPIDSISEGWSFAVPPTCQVFMTGKKAAGGAGDVSVPTSKLLMAKDEGLWWLTYGCTEEKGEELVEFAESMKEKAERANRLYGQLSEETMTGMVPVFVDDSGGTPLEKAKEVLRQKTGETDPMVLDLLAARVYGEILPLIIKESMK